MTTSASPVPHDLPAASHAYLALAATSLREAMTSTEVPTRYACAHVAALRATAALLAARATPTVAPRRGRRQKNAWVLLAEIAPELAEWAAFFSAGAAKRAAAEAGSHRAVTEREADDLVRDADRFLGLVEESLGMTRHVPLDLQLPAAGGVPAGSAGSTFGLAGRSIA
jgi:SAV_6107-like HEPN